MRAQTIYMLLAGVLLLGGLISCSSEEDSPDLPATVIRLTLAKGENSAAAANISSDASQIAVLQLKLTPGSEEEIRVDSILFTETGTGNAQADIGSIGLYVDADGDGAYSPAMDTVNLGAIAGGYAANDTASFSTLNRTIAPSATEYWLLVYSFSGTAGVGDSFVANVQAGGDVSAQGSGSGILAQVSGAPVTGNTFTIQNIGSLTVSAGANQPPASYFTTPPATLPVLQVNLEAGSTEDVQITSVTFTAGGTGNADSNVSSVLLYDDADGSGTVTGGDTQIGAPGTFSGSTVTFGGLSETIGTGSANAENWLVVCTFGGGTPGDTISVGLASNGDVTATGVTSTQAISPVGAPVPGNLFTAPNTLTVSAGASNPAFGNIANPPVNAPMLQVRLEAGPHEDVDISSMTFTAGGSGNADADIASVSLYDDADGSGTVTGGDVQIAGPGTFSSGTVQFSGLSETISAGLAGAETWLVVCTFTGGNSGDTYTVSLLSAADVSAAGALSAVAITPAGTPVTGNAQALQIGSLTVSLGSNTPPAGNMPVPPTQVPMLQVRLEAGTAEGVSITSITFTAGGTGTPDTDLANVMLYNDTDGSGTITGGDTQIAGPGAFSSGSVQFSGLSETISAGVANAEHWLVVCDVVNGATGNTYSVSLANGSDVTASGAQSGYSVQVSGAPVNGNALILSAPPTLVITTKRLPYAMLSAAYSFTLQCTGGTSPFTWAVSSGNLPTGLLLAGATGVISGTPTAGAQIFTVQVTDSGAPQVDTQLLAIEVDPAGSVIVSVIQGGGGAHTTIGAAVTAIPNPVSGTHIIEIRDSATYTENVDLTFTTGGSGGAAVIIRSKYDCLPTVQASNANDHVIELQVNGGALFGLRITGATGTGFCGVKVATGLWNAGIWNCVIFGNDIAIDNSGNPGTRIESNTCHGTFGIYVGGGGSTFVRNNIIWATGAWAHREYPTPAMSCDYNLYHTPSGAIGFDGTTYYNTLAAWQAHSGNDANGKHGNPNLANPGGGDFHLTASSALAIDQGMTGWSFVTDAEGYARNYGGTWDIGAFERH